MAIQFIPLIAAIVGGAATVGAGAYAYKSYQEGKEPVPAPILLKAEPEPKKEPEVKIVMPRKPKFHLLQVENDGSVVIAGSAPDKSKVEIIHGDAVISTTKAATNGDFAIVTENPLKPGTYELFIKATTTDNKVVMSEQAGIVSIPERGGEIIAMVSTPGKAVSLVQIPEPKVEPAPEPVPAPLPVKKVEPKPAPVEVVKVEPKPEIVVTKVEPPKPVVKEISKPAPKPVIVAKVEEPKVEIKPQPKPKPKVIRSVLLGAVEVEEGKLFVAGTGEPGYIVNIYIDDKFIGTASVNSQGAYLLEAESDLDYGEHTVRADMSTRTSAVVLARAQVPLIHDAPPKPIVVAKAPDPEPTPVITRKLVVPEPKVEPARNAGAVEIAKVAPPKPIKPVVEKPRRVIRTGSSVIIRKGDNLWRVSRRILGRGIRYSTIYNANRNQIKNPSLIFPGQIFKIPEKVADSGEVKEG